MEHEVAILTPDKSIVTYRLAGIPSRAVCHLLDVVLVLAIILAVALVSAYTIGKVDSGVYMMVIGASTFLVPLGYFIISEAVLNGQTLGKKASRLRVRMADGRPITWNAAVTRNLLRVADLLPGVYLVGMVCVFTNPRAQRIGDMVAGTIVVVENRESPRYALAPHHAGIHPLEGQVGDLPGMTSDEYHALKRLADRFPELPHRVQDDLISELWVPFAERRRIPVNVSIHPLYQIEAVVMKYGREHGLL